MASVLISLEEYQELKDEIERLREALQEIAAWKLSPDADTPIYMANIAEDALKEKE